SQEVAELQETATRLGSAAWAAPPPSLRGSVLTEISRTRQVARGPLAGLGEGTVRRWRQFAAAAVAAGVFALGGVGVTWAVQEHRLQQAEERTQALADRQARVDAVLAAPDVRFNTVDVRGGGRMTVAVAPSLHRGVALMSDLPAPAEGQLYQLWALGGGTTTSAGVMAEGQRSGVALLGDLTGVQVLAVTMEPAPSGSPAPTTDVLAGVGLT
ncbi:MAG: anti-sigma factor domain-containing protein, partial [Micromonosporaceae bacterium]